MSEQFFSDLGEWITKTSLGDIPEEVKAIGKRAIVDYVGVTFAGTTTDIGDLLARYATHTNQPSEATVIGSDRRSSAAVATFVNATNGHALDFDDCSESMGGHPTIVSLPPAFAIAERLGASGADLLEAYLLAFEVGAKIGRAVMVDHTHYTRGWHPTATLGVFMSATAAAKLLGLDAERTATALSIAASMASGMKANFGTMSKPIQVGKAAENGLFAAEMAALGATANPGAFEHFYGFGRLYNGEGLFDAELGRSTLGDPWDLVSPGIAFKQFPCCASTHSSIEAGIELHDQVADVDDVAAIRINPFPRRLPHTDRMVVTTGFEGKFSVQYCTAVALTRGYVGIQDFSQDAVEEARIQRLISITEATPLVEERWGEDQYASEVTVVLKDGREIMSRIERPRGSNPDTFLTDEEILRKFSAACRAAGADDGRIGRLFDLSLTIDDQADLGEYFSVLAMPPVASAAR